MQEGLSGIYKNREGFCIFIVAEFVKVLNREGLLAEKEREISMILKREAYYHVLYIIQILIDTKIF